MKCFIFSVQKQGRMWLHDCNKLQFGHFPVKLLLTMYSTYHYMFPFLTWLIIHIILDFKCLRTHTKGDFFLVIWKIIHSIIKNPVEKKMSWLTTIGDFRFEYEYENDFSVLVCRFHIITTWTHLIPWASFST